MQIATATPPPFVPLPMRRLLFRTLPALAVLTGACSSATQGTAGAPTDRVLITDAQGQTIRQSALNEWATVTFNAPVARTWPAVVAAYADVGIEANYADRANGRYGVRNFDFPRTLKGERIGSFFSCGTSLAGAVVDASTVNSEIVTTIAPTADGNTRASIYVTGSARRNDGNSTSPIACVSTGKMEELLRTAIERRLSAN